MSRMRQISSSNEPQTKRTAAAAKRLVVWPHWFPLVLDQHPISALLKVGRSFLDVDDLKFESCLRDWNFVRPRVTAKARLRPKRKWPESKVLRPLKGSCMEITVFSSLKGIFIPSRYSFRLVATSRSIGPKPAMNNTSRNRPFAKRPFLRWVAMHL